MVQLLEMRNTVRRMTARYSPAQMPDTQIDRYINLAYTLHFPEQFKNLKLTKPYVFTTIPNVDTYAFLYENNPANNQGQSVSSTPGNITISPPVYCQGYILRYSQDKSVFYNRWPKLSVNQQIDTGTGALTVYTGTIPSTPFLRAQQDIFGNVTEAAVIISGYDNSGFSFSLTDIPQINSNTGLLVDSNSLPVGLVNYVTGAYSFSLVIPPNTPIFAAVVPYQSSRPTDVIFYNQQITFRPVPQQVYQVEFQISQQPTDLIADSDAPELDVWYLFICALAAELIYVDFPDPQGMAELQPTLDKQRLIAQRTSLRQMGSQRAATIFSHPGRPLASWFYGTQYSGN
jgi:hypothetical protein